jgi:hypothetical protein
MGFLHLVINQFPVNELLLSRLRDMGVSGYRAGGDAAANFLTDEPGIYNFSQIDEAIETTVQYGDVFANIGAIPPEAVGGVKAYGGGLVDEPRGGCLRFVRPDGGVGVDNLVYAHDLDYCENPPLNIDRQVIFNQGAAFAGRPWATKVSWVGIGNERDDPNYPTKHLIDRDWQGDWQPAAQHTLLFVDRPFIDGWKSVLPKTIIMGPECATAGYLASMYKAQTVNLLANSSLLETSASARLIHDAWTPGYVYDVLSGHLYQNEGMPFLAGSLGRLYGWGGYIPYLKSVGWKGEIPFTCGECGPSDSSPQDIALIPEFIESLWAMHTVEFVTLYSPHHFFGDGTIAGLKAQLVANKCEPNELYGRVQKVMSRIESKHRAVGK